MKIEGPHLQPAPRAPGGWGNLMRSLKTLIAAAGVLALSIGVPAALMAPAASAATTPVVYTSGSGGWSHPSVRPSWIEVGQGGAPVAHTWHWSTWDKDEPNPHATSAGTLLINNCIPNCAQGKESFHKLVVTLSVAKTHNGVRYYSRMTWYTPGYRLYGYRTSTAVLHYSVTYGTVPYWH
jgi:hypothetical protein